MIYVFVFLGEFGYELLNWQGVVRKFSYTISQNDKIVCCSRANLYPIYETAHYYIDISDYPLFQKSIACGYVGMIPPENTEPHNPSNVDYNLKRPIKDFYASYNTPEDLQFDLNLKLGLKKYIINTLLSNKFDTSSIKFIFSSERHEINGCIFGCDRSIFEVGMPEGDIYENLNLNNNLFKQILPDFSIKNLVKEKCEIVNTDYILVQMAERKIVKRSSDKLYKINHFLKSVSKKYPIVLLNFSTNRNLDSYSYFESIPNCYYYSCSSFVEQSYLIYSAKKCLFFTEGDFRSHIYIPPLMGKDVIAVAPKSVYQLNTAPISFWNENVFKFCGQIIPLYSEDVFSKCEIDLLQY